MGDLEETCQHGQPGRADRGGSGSEALSYIDLLNR